jgi:hypothetical protein
MSHDVCYFYNYHLSVGFYQNIIKYLLCRPYEDGMILTKFEETPIMSTYLLAIIVSDLATLDTNINSKISIYAPVRVRNYE